MKFALADVVLIRKLLTTVRDVDGDSAEPPQPHLGELGVVTASVGDDLYLVEHATDDGSSLWVAEFHAEELELLDRPTP